MQLCGHIQRLTFGLSVRHAVAQAGDQAGGGFIVHQPVAGDDSPRTGSQESSRQRPDTFPVLLWPVVRLARAEDREFTAL